MTSDDGVVPLITASAGRDDVDPLYQLLPLIAGMGLSGELAFRYQLPSPGEAPTGYRLRDTRDRHLFHIESVRSNPDVGTIDSSPALVTVRLEPPAGTADAQPRQAADPGVP